MTIENIPSYILLHAVTQYVGLLKFASLTNFLEIYYCLHLQ
jgi:hypothetical protein